ncbi:hypothetical protein F5Y17DRAFT_439832 [Xylariaceae sp. FL0594]|nr:hypothetical protein F5Y17DRAFT_439832 [Xylariaceae sp. FL0594]
MVDNITGSEGKEPNEKDKDTAATILRRLVHPFFICQRNDNLFEKIKELLKEIETGRPQSPVAEMRSLISSKHRPESQPELFTQEGVAELAGLAPSQKEGEPSPDSLASLSEAYHESSLQKFTNDIKHAVEDVLITYLPTFLTSEISEMDSDRLEVLARDSNLIGLKNEEAFRKALDLCKSFRDRDKLASTCTSSSGSDTVSASSPFGNRIGANTAIVGVPNTAQRVSRQ